jgi:hypothetical protein
MDYPGTHDVIAKLSQWLAVRTSGVSVAVSTALDWDFPYGGDADDNNRIGTLDLATVLMNFGETGPNIGDLNLDGHVGTRDLALPLMNFGLKGDT